MSPRLRILCYNEIAVMKKIVIGQHKGFTLIELLVVISIIGVLSTLLLANFNATRLRARDAQRKSDLRNIQTALRLYYNDFGSYPLGTGDINGCGTGTTACTWGESFKIDEGNTYMPLLPEDPVATDTYNYSYNSTGGDTYTLSTCLENPSDDKCAASTCFDSDGSGCTYSVSP